MGDVQDYFGTLEPETRAAYERVRDQVVALVPEATEGTSYGVAALMYRGKPLIGFRAAKTHLSVFPYSGRAVAAALGHLEGFDTAKGTVLFDVDTPLPADAIHALVEQRVAEIEGRA
ncbi:MAG TPA: DUF1801 domain-containing protein [Gaiellaceae bacterium]|jgi:uncharacterized protein YdhG (YjbR/CyaY superfamily)|nr:DUF1801 domain-containing protein [Gaiellaceae bacterium]